jgi:hypothetical protein
MIEHISTLCYYHPCTATRGSVAYGIEWLIFVQRPSSWPFVQLVLVMHRFVQPITHSYNHYYITLSFIVPLVW